MADVKILSANNVDYSIKDEVARLAIQNMSNNVLHHYDNVLAVNIEDALALIDEHQFYEYLFTNNNNTGSLVSLTRNYLWTILNIPAASDTAGTVQLAFCMSNTQVWYRRKTWWSSGETPFVWSAWRPLNYSNYSTSETLTGKYWIDGRPIYRKVINMGTLPNHASKNVEHGITNVAMFTDVRGVALYSNPEGITVLPVPYVATMNDNSDRLSLFVNSTVVHMSSLSYDFTMYSGYVILEYTKSTD